MTSIRQKVWYHRRVTKRRGEYFSHKIIYVTGKSERKSQDRICEKDDEDKSFR